MNDDLGVVAPIVVPAPPKKFSALVIPLIAILAMILSLGLTLGLVVTNTANINRNCQTNLQTYNTLVVIIDHVEHPPALLGVPLTELQKHALHIYADNLRAALPAKPVCHTT